LNYFFGQNGPGPLSGATVERAGNTGEMTITSVGRDASGNDLALRSGLMAGKRGMEGNNAAFDMKSLGKHIEAVSMLYNSRTRAI
jgi:dynamin 1-like protein